MEYYKEMICHQDIINAHQNVISFMLLVEQDLVAKIHQSGPHVHGVTVG
jgi:hypothetical protein